MIAALCAGFAAVCFFALGWLFSSWFNEKHDCKVITTVAPAAEKFFLPLAYRSAIQTAIPYLISAHRKLVKKKSDDALSFWMKSKSLEISIDRLKKLIEYSAPIYDNR